ncbi:hypothetical protein J3Q64DRAFT_1736865 [Phycomyces blakesleeanus]|uniref:Uncharacterized protein n=1 Tax=Phycomyces blakesleeanus TaxID=4837 RepID=A0ABR3B163_PHYBL
MTNTSFERRLPPIGSSNTFTDIKTDMNIKIYTGRGKNYCLIHRRYFETSWCPDCACSSCH